VISWLNIYLLFADFLQCTCQKYEHWLAVDKFIAIINRVPLLWLTVYIFMGQLHCGPFVQFWVFLAPVHYKSPPALLNAQENENRY